MAYDEKLIEAAREAAWQALGARSSVSYRGLSNEAMDAIVVAVLEAAEAARWRPSKPPALMAAVRHVHEIAYSYGRPTEEDYKTSHGLLVDLVLSLHPPRVSIRLDNQLPPPPQGD